MCISYRTCGSARIDGRKKIYNLSTLLPRCPQNKSKQQINNYKQVNILALGICSASFPRQWIHPAVWKHWGERANTPTPTPHLASSGYTQVHITSAHTSNFPATWNLFCSVPFSVEYPWNKFFSHRLNVHCSFSRMVPFGNRWLWRVPSHLKESVKV